MATTSEDVWRILAELATAQAELTAAQKETDKQLKEVSQQQKETDRPTTEGNRATTTGNRPTTQRIRTANWGTWCQIRQLYRRTCPSLNGNDSQTKVRYGSC